MKPWTSAALAALLALAVHLPAQADVTYKYASTVYDSITNYIPPCAGGTCLNLVTGARIQGTFTTTDPLPANYPDSFSALPLIKNWTFVNGTETIRSTDPGARVIFFNVQTDQSGTPIRTRILVSRWIDDLPSSHSAGDWVNFMSANIQADGPDVNFTMLNGRCNQVRADDACVSQTALENFGSTATYVTGTLQMDAPLVSISSPTITEGNAGATSMVFDVTLSKAPDTAASLAWYTLPGTSFPAEPPFDYAANGGSLTWAAGDGSPRTITVQVNGDTTPEPDETLQVLLHNLVGIGGAVTKGIGTITNDDAAAPPPSVSITSVSLTEGNTGTRNVDLTVRLSHSPTSPATLRWQTDDGTATAASGDYVAASGTLQWSAGDPVAQNITVQINGDTTPEPNETFAVRLLNLSGISGGDSTVGLVTIQNDDGSVPTMISTAPATGTEGGDVTFNVSLSQTPARDVSVQWETRPGTATAPGDFISASGTLNWAAGDGTPKTITIKTVADTTPEADETFRLLLINPVGALVETGSADVLGTVQNAAAPPPVGGVQSVPTLADWALLLLSLLTMGLGWGHLRKLSQK